MKVTLLTAALVGLVLGVSTPASADGIVPNPVVNPDFELHIPPEVGAAVQDTPLDECIGIGHQVLYGSETWQHKAIDEQDPAAAAEQITADPEGEATRTAGYGHCVFSDEEGFDLAWLNPASLAQREAIHWSTDLDPSTTFGDNDGDGDREAIVGTTGSGHNMWQAYPSPHQAFTANFNALEFDLEAGALHRNAKVIISLSATPLEAQTDRAVLYFDCQITFGSSLFSPDADGHIAVDPTDAAFRSRHSSCDSAAQAWADGDADARRAILGRLRIVQLSFWGFEQAPLDEACGCAAQIDNVSLTNATTAVEEAVLNQNVNLG